MTRKEVAQVLIEIWNLIIEKKNELLAVSKRSEKILTQLAEIEQDTELLFILMENLFGSIDNTIFVACQ